MINHVRIRNIKGFTLIELLVVVAIIGILAAVGTVAYSGYTSAAKKSVIKNNHAAINKFVIAEFTMCMVDDNHKVLVLQDNDYINCYDVSNLDLTKVNAHILEYVEANYDKAKYCSGYYFFPQNFIKFTKELSDLMGVEIKINE